MNKNTFYFSHDYNARNDEKIKELIFKHGMSGYGIYWSIIEELYQNANALLLNYERIAFELRTECELVKSVINEFNLFIINDKNFSSLSVEKRLNERSLKSEKARLSADKRWSNANAMQSHSEGNAIKERKVKEKRVIYIPSLDEVELYFKENGYTKDSAVKAFNYYSENNWKDSRNNQVKNWKQKMQGVWFKEENKIKNEQLPAHLTRLLN
jgi:hypothetical protein